MFCLPLGCICPCGLADCKRIKNLCISNCCMGATGATGITGATGSIGATGPAGPGTGSSFLIPFASGGVIELINQSNNIGGSNMVIIGFGSNAVFDSPSDIQINEMNMAFASSNSLVINSFYAELLPNGTTDIPNNTVVTATIYTAPENSTNFTPTTAVATANIPSGEGTGQFSVTYSGPLVIISPNTKILLTFVIVGDGPVEIDGTISAGIWASPGPI